MVKSLRINEGLRDQEGGSSPRILRTRLNPILIRGQSLGPPTTSIPIESLLNDSYTPTTNPRTVYRFSFRTERTEMFSLALSIALGVSRAQNAQDIMVDSLSREHPGITFAHAAPGFVNTNWGTEMPWCADAGRARELSARAKVVQAAARSASTTPGGEWAAGQRLPTFHATV